MKRNQWRGRGGLNSVHEVLDTSPSQKLWGTQRSWRRLVGRALGQATACLGVNAHSELRIMAANDATRDEILARGDHILAAWNALARQYGTRTAGQVLCWVNREVGRRSTAGGRNDAPAVGRAVEAKTPATIEPVNSEDRAALALGDGADPELVTLLARIGKKRGQRFGDGG